MSQIGVERFLGRILTDANFRARAMSSIENTCCCEGIVLSNKEMSFLCKIDFLQFNLIAEHLDDSIKRF